MATNATEDSAGAADSPGLLADVFARVGGPDKVEVFADVMIDIGADAG
jgi:hypothetical protein